MIELEVMNYVRDEINHNPDLSVAWLSLAGSRSHNLSTPESDYDYSGVYFRNPRLLYTDPDGSTKKSIGFRREINGTVHEGILYEFTHFFQLLTACNPSILEIVWRDTVSLDVPYSPVIDCIKNRDKFLTSKIKFTYGGYANSQYYKITQGNHTMYPKAIKHIFRLMFTAISALDTKHISVGVTEGERNAIHSAIQSSSKEELIEMFDDLDNKLNDNALLTSLPQNCDSKDKEVMLSLAFNYAVELFNDKNQYIRC